MVKAFVLGFKELVFRGPLLSIIRSVMLQSPRDRGPKSATFHAHSFCLIERASRTRRNANLDLGTNRIMPLNCLSGIRIVVVEDHAYLRSLLMRFLLKEGATVTACASASEGADKV